MDAAVELASLGHKVHIFTVHHDKSRCFEEILSGNILADQVSVVVPVMKLKKSKDEHFGIVPLEAMSSYKPVIACNSGGPVETVKNGVTGFLCDPNPQEFSLAMAKFGSSHGSRHNGARWPSSCY
ncbi:hypothetical protein K7X08_005529 [Anisodus acutangulus]|uniref:Glycosyl transferase family 1 domain-containing protein n=1 Tax=Anisodus acutangulus TaxID=402998 RepID=A0A9Q1R7B5_9SOLA|nr:hypothetical protein K7X08_005529 [Anisodus acutangulus]